MVENVSRESINRASESLELLERQIRESADGQRPVETELATSQRVIARITDGIYREPWAAFRELIANAYDADASYVIVETAAPDFTQITVRDDGSGMSPKTLAYVLKNIGGSSKRTATGVTLNTAQEKYHDKSPGGRLLIGKIGIGLFAVAQLTQHFQIITKASGDDLRTSATVKLRTHDENAIPEDEDEYAAGFVTIKSEKVPENEKESHGTAVVLYSLRPEVRIALQSVRRWRAALLEPDDGEAVQDEPTYHIGCPENAIEKGHVGRKPNLPWLPGDTPQERFEKFFRAVGNVSGRGTKSANLQFFDDYLRLMWKLSLSLPLDYLGCHPFDLKGSSELQFFDFPKNRRQSNRISLEDDTTIRNFLNLRSGKDAQLNGFSVILDGVELRRPIRLPLKLEKNSRIRSPVIMVARQDNPFKKNELERAGGPLSFDAYLYWNSKIVPKDTAGVLIRIREASGTLFDSTFLNYQVSEQTRLRQITAEVFIHEGLDSAINIDRESFNYSHPHFLFLQRWLHQALRLLVNRLKALASEDLEREKAERSERIQIARQSHAERIWQKRLGLEADPPLQDFSSNNLPIEVGGAEIEWTPEDGKEIQGETDKIRGLAVILEAYGVLSNLSIQDRARLMKDILDLFEVKR